MNLGPNEKIALVACSNQLNISSRETINNLISLLKGFNLNVVLANNIFKEDSSYSSGLLRAIELNKFFKDNSINYIFDVSGGDLCNEILPHLDFECIKTSKATYFGYSDLSVLLNSIYAKVGKVSYYYNIRNILSNSSLKDFYNTFIDKNSNYTLFNSLKYNWIIGDEINGIVIGGNIRCTLKLAGTDYLPSFKDKILFLESNSGDITKIRTYITQYSLLNAFSSIKGVILGEFTELSVRNQYDELKNIMEEICLENNLPLVTTQDLGHSINAKGIGIGKYINIKK